MQTSELAAGSSNSNLAQTAALARRDAVDALVNFASQFRDQVALRRGIAGNGLGTLEVVGAQSRVYVELGGSGGPVVEAQYDQFVPTLGNGVYLMRPRIFGPGGWIILGQCSGTDLPCVPAA